MVLDTSAILAVLLAEPDRARFETAVAQTASALVSAGTYLEAAIVVEARFGEAGGRELDELLRRWSVTIEPVDTDQVDIGRRAYRTYGRGRHTAGLNYGDCFAYALAIATGEPLLFKGEDFSRTDVPIAITPDE
jgi:ribonuclease VapC